jgi:hypothetical protein
MAKETWDPVGTVYRRRPPQKDNSWVGGLIVIVLICAALAQCSG